MSIREDLKAYLDGELSPERAREVEAAVQSDAQLKTELEQMRLLGMEIRAAAPQLEISGKERARQLVTASKKPWWSPSSPKGRLVWAGACAAIAMVAMFPLMRNIATGAADASADQAVAFRASSESGTAGGTAAETASPDAMAKTSVPGDERSQGSAHRGAANQPGVESQAESGAMPPASAEDSKSELRPVDPSVNAQIGANTAEVPQRDAAKQRAMIKRGDFGLHVSSIEAAEEKIEQLAKSLGGKVLTSISTEDGDRKTSGSITIQVPSAAFEKAVEGLKGIGSVVAREVRSDDVETLTAQNREKAKKLQESKDEYARQARQRANEVARKRLEETEKELDRLEKANEDLKKSAEKATLTIKLSVK